MEDPSRQPPDWAFLADPTTLAFVALAGAMASLALAAAGALSRAPAPALRASGAWPARLLAAPLVSLEVLKMHPELDPLAAVGLALPETAFIRGAGAVELVLGLLLLSGIGGRAVVLVAAVPFAVTVPIFGFREIVGHLPIFGALAFIAASLPPARHWRQRDRTAAIRLQA